MAEESVGKGVVLLRRLNQGFFIGVVDESDDLTRPKLKTLILKRRECFHLLLSAQQEKMQQKMFQIAIHLPVINNAESQLIGWHSKGSQKAASPFKPKKQNQSNIV